MRSGGSEMTLTERPSRYIWAALRLVYRAAPRPFRALVALTLVVGAGPSVVLWIGKVVIDEVARLITVRAGVQEFDLTSSPTLLWAAVGFVVLQIALDGIGTQSDLQTAALSDQVEHVSQSMMLEKISEFPDLALFEDVGRLDIIQTAEAGALRLHQLANITQNLMTGLFTFIPVLVLSLRIGWWVPVLLAGTATPSILVQLRYEAVGWTLEQSNAQSYRRMAMYARCLTEREFATELRLYRLRPLLLTRWSTTFHTAYDAVRRVRTKAAVRIFAWSALSGLGASLPYVFVIDQAVGGRYSLGDIALLTGVVFELQRALLILIGNAVSLQGVALGCRSFFQLQELDSSLVPGYARESRSPETVPRPVDRCVLAMPPVSFEDVSFSYPGTEEIVLKHVNFTLETGRLTVIVGENGAGKTTIAKLLCRLYDPTQGRITVGGEDVRHLELDEWRSSIAVVGQHFARYPETLRDNIAFGSVDDMENDDRVLAAAEQVGLDEMIAGLPEGLGTHLSREFPGGEEPSGGQWQRIALARAFMARERRGFLVLDEPTASLDPNAEHEALAAIQRLASDRVAVVISHRLALARRAAQILVLADGRLVEQGTHTQLIQQRGFYFDLFSKQASSYAADTPDIDLDD